MDTRDEIKEFLTTRRASITPDQAGLPAYGGTPPGQGAPPRGGRHAGGHQRRVLHPPRARERQRRLRGRRSTASPGRCSSTRPSARHLFDLVRSGQRHRPGRAGAPVQERVRPSGAAHPRRHDRRARLRPQRPPRRPRRQPARPGLLRADVRRARSSHPTLARFVFLNPRGRGVLPRLGPHRRRHRRHPAQSSRTRPVRPAALRPHRRALHPQRASSASAGPRTTSSSTAAASKRFHHPVVGDLTLDLRGARPPRRPRPADARLHRRARLAIGRGASACSPAGPPPRPHRPLVARRRRADGRDLIVVDRAGGRLREADAVLLRPWPRPRPRARTCGAAAGRRTWSGGNRRPREGDHRGDHRHDHRRPATPPAGGARRALPLRGRPGVGRTAWPRSTDGPATRSCPPGRCTRATTRCSPTTGASARRSPTSATRTCACTSPTTTRSSAEFDLLGTNLGEFLGLAPDRAVVPGPGHRRVHLRRRPASPTSGSTSTAPACSARSAATDLLPSPGWRASPPTRCDDAVTSPTPTAPANAPPAPP